MKRQIMAIVILVAALLPAQAFAYLDPGTGSMLAQVILGGLAGLAVVLKLFWHRFVRFITFGKVSPGIKSTDDEAAD